MFHARATADVMTPGFSTGLASSSTKPDRSLTGLSADIKGCGSERCFRERKWRRVGVLTASRFPVKPFSPFFSKKTIEIFSSPFFADLFPTSRHFSHEITVARALNASKKQRGDSAKSLTVDVRSFQVFVEIEIMKKLSARVRWRRGR